MARRKLDIDADQVAEMALHGCSNVEIAGFFGCVEGTIRGRFCELLAKKRAERKWNIRKAQDRLVQADNATMLIWLGKQELGQKDKQTLEHSGKDGEPIKHAVAGFDHDRFASLYQRRTGGVASRSAASPADDN